MAITLIYHENDRLLKWAAERIGIDQFMGDAQAIGVARDGELVGVAVFDTFSSSDCHIHVASDGTGHWLTREFLIHVFAYVFITCGYLRVTSLIAESNKKSLRFNRHLGFMQEGYHPYAALDGGAMITTGLLRANCRFLPESARHMRNN